MSAGDVAIDEKEQGTASPLLCHWRVVALIIAVGGLWLLALFCDLGRRLAELESWVASLGSLAPLGFVLLRAAAAILVVPGSAISASAGVLFSPLIGVLCVSAGKTLGAVVAFLVGRYFARNSVESWLGQRDAYRKLDRMVRDHGALVVALNRLLPLVPFNVQNYAFGLTAVPFGIYLLWTWLGMLPGAVLVVSGMTVVRRTLATGQVPWGLLVLFGISLVTMLALGALTFLSILRRQRA